MLIIRKQQTGVTLIELLIGMLIGLIIVAAGISVFVTSFKGQTDNIKLSRLNQDMRSMMDIMERDIRRAGFATSDPANNLAALKNNPFFNDTGAATTDLTSPSKDCILYAYNRDNDTQPPQVDPEERLGFRLNDKGELQMRQTGSTNTKCDDGEWESITEPEVKITGLEFTIKPKELNVTSMTIDTDADGCYDGDDQDPNANNPNCKAGTYGNNLCDAGEGCNTCTRDGVSPDPACLYVRDVVIKLAGSLRDDNAVTQTINEQVRVRNDKFLDAIP